MNEKAGRTSKSTCAQEVVITIDSVKKRFEGSNETDVIDIDHLEIYSGEFVCILGPSGCGKSTLLKLVSGALSTTAGEVKVHNQRVVGPVPGVIQLYQQYGLFPWRTVRENIKFGLELNVEANSDSESAVGEYLELVGLTRYADFKPNELSGGMKQRVALARALAVEPNVLLMDEPLAALDSVTRINLQSEIESIWQKKRKTIVWVTHDIEEAITLADRIIVMEPHPGRIKAIAKIDLPRPRDQLSENFFAAKKQVAQEFSELHSGSK